MDDSTILRSETRSHASDDEVARLRELLTTLRTLPPGEARTMPGAYYTSGAFLALERAHLFRADWACIGHAAEIAQPGDYFTADLVGEPLLAVRGPDMKIRVLSNVCRHRANLVAKGAGHGSRFVCSYHGWSYGLDGANLGAPFMAKVPGFDKTKCALPEFKSEIWQDFIFVNLDGNAAPLTPRLDGFLPKIRNYHHPGRHHQFAARETWKTNWKCLVENFMEGYHLSVAHAKTLHAVTPTSLCRKIEAPAGMTAYTAGYDPKVPERGPFHPDLTAEERRYSVMFAVFPNLVVGVVPNATLYMVMNPLDADTVDTKWGIAGTIADPDHPDVLRYRDLVIAFNAEDREQLENVQKGLKSRHYTTGPLAPADFEGTIWDFTQWAAGKLASNILL